MAGPMVKFEWRTNTLVAAATNLPKRFQEEARKVVEKNTQRVFEMVKFATPVDSGRALAGWRIEIQSDGKAGRVVNRVPYINVLEFGGYPVRALSRVRDVSRGFVRGNAILGGQFPPGPRTMAVLGGDPPMNNNISKQAPSGMIRKAIGEIADIFEFDLAEALEAAWEND